MVEWLEALLALEWAAREPMTCPKRQWSAPLVGARRHEGCSPGREGALVALGPMEREAHEGEGSE